MSELGRLEEVPLRQAWKNEAGDFTPWLAKEENLALLSEALGLSLELEGTEQGVGPYSADIVCRDVPSGRIVLIENQLEKTDHTHLGQIFTYAAGVDAVLIVWIAKRFTEEHRAAVDWLNRITSPEFHFFGLEVQLWRISNSPIAPRFNIVSKPNDWAKTATAAISAKSKELSQTQKDQFAFWAAFAEWLEEHSELPRRTPKPSAYCIFPVGRTGVWMAGCITTWNSESNKNTPEMRVELVIQTNDSKEQFDRLLTERESIEAKFGEPLKWDRGDGSKRSRIYMRCDADFTEVKQWERQFDWMARRLEKVQEIIAPAVIER